MATAGSSVCKLRRFIGAAAVALVAALLGPGVWEAFAFPLGQSSTSRFLGGCQPGKHAASRILMRNQMPGSDNTPLLPRNNLVQESREKHWWEEQSNSFVDKMKVKESIDSIERLRQQMTAEEAAFDQELEDIVIAGKRALLRLRMQKAVETPGMKMHLFKVIKKQIARALTLRREREIARGITREQSRRMRRRRRLELKMKYEAAYGAERPGPKSRKWLRRMGKII